MKLECGDDGSLGPLRWIAVAVVLTFAGIGATISGLVLWALYRPR
jgi:hypothetical protein